MREAEGIERVAGSAETRFFTDAERTVDFCRRRCRPAKDVLHRRHTWNTSGSRRCIRAIPLIAAAALLPTNCRRRVAPAGPLDDGEMAAQVVGLMKVQFEHPGRSTARRWVRAGSEPRASRTVPSVVKRPNGRRDAPRSRPARMGRQDLPSRAMGEEMCRRYYSVKEAVVPRNKFPAVRSLLGREMKSTGEVMGAWAPPSARRSSKARSPPASACPPPAPCPSVATPTRSSDDVARPLRATWASVWLANGGTGGGSGGKTASPVRWSTSQGKAVRTASIWCEKPRDRVVITPPRRAKA